MEERTIIKAYKYRMYPNEEQRTFFAKTFGCCRYVYNHFYFMKEESKKAWKEDHSTPFLSYVDMTKLLTQLKRDTVDEDGHAWLYDADATALVYSIRNLDHAYSTYTKRKKEYIAMKTARGEKIPPEAAIRKDLGYPKPKSRYSRKSYKTAGKNVTVDYENNRIKLPKIGYVKCRPHRPYEGRIVSATVSEDGSGRCFVSLQCDGVPAPTEKAPADMECAVEVGVRQLAVLDNGTVYDNPRAFRKLAKKLALEQARLSRMKGPQDVEGGSNNYRKQRKKVARIHARIADCRADAHHKLSRELVDTYGVLYVRDNDVKEMVKCKREKREVPRSVERALHNSVLDSAMSGLAEKIAYKAQWADTEVIRPASDFPSTQLCSECGYKNEKLAGIAGLAIRKWTCPACGAKHDREINSARNLMAEGRRIRQAGE